MRDIERGDGYALDCHCGSRLCRGKVSDEDWKLPELRQRYGDYISICISNKFKRG